MRLLEILPNGHFCLTQTLLDDAVPRYAILSHTWGDHSQEVIFDDMVEGTGQGKAGYKKIKFCGEQAARDGLQYFWVDSCCIKKSSDAELSESLNSMFRWYQRAAKCYVYLSDVSSSNMRTGVVKRKNTWEQAFRNSRWFTRGWTLQELIAPESVEFFSSEGKRLGDKRSLVQQICEITAIAPGALQGGPLSSFSVDERLAWATKRQTTRKEDKAYCLLGIFDVYLPPIYGEGDNAFKRLKAEIAKSLKDNPSRRLPYAEDAPSNSFFTVPFRRDPDFVDRGDTLAQIDQRCSQPAGRAALVGLGGVGKSQLAIEYAHRVRQRSPKTWVFWVHASNTARLEAAYKGIADKLALPGRHQITTNVMELVFNWMSEERNGQWLMIVDNADDFGTISARGEESEQNVSVASLLPQSRNGAILVTSRSMDVAREITGRDKDIIEVGTMNESEATQLLQNKLTGSSDDNMTDLLGTLDYIPLAITQAAAYINRQPHMSVSAYLLELRNSERKTVLLKKAASDMRRDEKASNSILATWQISFEQIRSERSSAADLLSFMSFFNRQGIPNFMLRYYRGKGGIETVEQGDTVISSKEEEANVEFEEDIALLRSFSLIASTYESEFEMHGLVQFATRVWLGSIGAEGRWWGTFVAAMTEAFPTGEYENWSTCRALLPHVQSIAEKKRPFQEGESEKRARVLTNAGWYAWRQGLLSQAEEMIKDSYEECEKSFGMENSQTLLNLSILGSILTAQGRYKESEEISRRALVGYEKNFGEDHNNILACLNNLALALRHQGKYEEAEEMNRRVLEGAKKKLGEDHPNTLICFSNLVQVLQDQGKYEESEGMTRWVLALREKKFGEDHPDTLMSVSNLAVILRTERKYEEAEGINRRVLTLREKKFGEDHPLTLTSMDNLAEVLRCQEKYDVAEEMNRRALVGYEKKLGGDHLDTLTSVHNLAMVMRDQGKYEESEGMNRRVLALREKKLGEDHPNTLTGVNNLAMVLRDQEKYEEAEEMHWRALAGREKKLGEDHPDTLTSVGGIAMVLWYQSKYEEAEKMNRRALVAYEKKFGEDHPTTLTSMHNLALIMRDQGKYEEAEKMNRRALLGYEKKLGKDHTDTLTSLYSLAYLLKVLKQYEEATGFYERAYTGFESRLGASHPTTISCHNEYVTMLSTTSQDTISANLGTTIERGINEESNREATGVELLNRRISGLSQGFSKYQRSVRGNSGQSVKRPRKVYKL